MKLRPRHMDDSDLTPRPFPKERGETDNHNKRVTPSLRGGDGGEVETPLSDHLTPRLRPASACVPQCGATADRSRDFRLRCASADRPAGGQANPSPEERGEDGAVDNLNYTSPEPSEKGSEEEGSADSLLDPTAGPSPSGSDPTPGASLKWSNLTPDPSPMERGEVVENPVPGYMTTDSLTWRGLKLHARENRRNATKAEKILWERLRNRKLGVRFRRQHAIGDFIVDFVCIEKKLVVEADGGIHEQQKAYDLERTKLLMTRGFRVLRFRNDEIIDGIDNVISRIRKELRSYSNKEASSPDRGEEEV